MELLNRRKLRRETIEGVENAFIEVTCPKDDSSEKSSELLEEISNFRMVAGEFFQRVYKMREEIAWCGCFFENTEKRNYLKIQFVG